MADDGFADHPHGRARITMPLFGAHRLLDRLQASLPYPLLAGAPDRRMLTDYGHQVLRLAHQRLDELERSGEMHPDRPVRLGVGSVFIDRFTQGLDELEACELSLSSGICFEVADAFANGDLDVAYMLDVKDNRHKLRHHIVAEHRIDLVWVKAPGFAFAAGKPLPLAIYPGDKPALKALDDAGRDYCVKFSSQEYLSKLSAVKSGKYITPMPRKLIEAPFVEVEGDLPPLPPASILVAARGDVTSDRFRPVMSALAHLHA